jgi:hypothetical protein
MHGATVKIILHTLDTHMTYTSQSFTCTFPATLPQVATEVDTN